MGQICYHAVLHLPDPPWPVFPAPLPRKTGGRTPRIEVILLSADPQASSVQAVESIAARLGQGGRLRVETGRERA